MGPPDPAQELLDRGDAAGVVASIEIGTGNRSLMIQTGPLKPQWAGPADLRRGVEESAGLTSFKER